MRGSWIIVQLMVLAGSLVKLLDGTSQGWMDQETPSCEELRAFWNMVSRTVRMSELTNEIPMLPWEAFSYVGGHRQRLEGDRRNHVKPESSPTMNTLQDNFFMRGSAALDPKTYQPMPAETPTSPYLAQTNWMAASNQEPNGMFGDFQDPRFAELGEEPNSHSFHSPSKAVSGTRKKAERELLHTPSWGIPSEVGMFGRFVDLDEELPLLPMSRASKHSSGEWVDPFLPSPSHEPVTTPRESCFQFINKDCRIDDDCTCAGWSALRCHHGKCVNQHLIGGKEGGYGLWHEGPVPTSKLGLLKRLRRRSSRSIFM